MKRNVKFFMTVIALLLLSAVILTGCMYAIAADNGETKPYDPHQREDASDGGVTQPGEKNPGNTIVEDAPTGQLPLQNKFNEYLHEDGNTVTVFSPEQYDRLKAVRDSGERTPLTYEEILFLVNDSINMYFKYDEIHLYNANVDGVLPLVLPFSAIQSSSSCIVKPYHGDFSEFEIYSEASGRYQRMLQEIYAIIYYRIYLHDAGFAEIRRGSDTVVTLSEWDDFWESYRYINSAWVRVYQMLTIDGSTMGGTENEDKLADEFRKVVEWERLSRPAVSGDDADYPYLNSAILYTDLFGSTRWSPECKFYIAGPKHDSVQQIYPTAELEKKKPQLEITYQAGEEGESQPILHLDYTTFMNGGAYLSAGIEFSFAMTGTFRLEDGFLKVYFGASQAEPDYLYVFELTDEGFVYSAESSKPESSMGGDWVDGLVFRKWREHVVVQPDPVPPVNNEKDPAITEEQWAYLKYDANNECCTLMSSEGSSVFEGSYAKEDDKLVFMFSTAGDLYMYYFHCRQDGVYVFDKGFSNAVPGYGFEDEMKFILTEWDGGSCFLEVQEE